MTQTETPVLLLTGYLGSGKTTLLNRILSNKKGIKFAVIVNDIGEVNIDASLIQKGGVVDQKDDSLVPLQNGCICCTLKMDLVQQLSDIVAQHRFDYIVIEASGICEPAPIAQTISAYPQVYPNLAEDGVAKLDSIVTVVDALRLRDEFSLGNDLKKKDLGEDDLANLVIQQVEFCNMILLNKASEVTPEELERIKRIVRELQPKAEIITCDFCDVDLEKLVNTHLFDFQKVATSARWIEAIEGDDENYEHHDSDDEEEEHEHHCCHHHDDDDDDEHEHHCCHHHDDDDDDEHEHHCCHHHDDDDDDEHEHHCCHHHDDDDDDEHEHHCCHHHDDDDDDEHEHHCCHHHDDDDDDEHEHHHHGGHCHCHCHHHHGLENEEEGEALEYGIGTFVYKRREPFNLTEFDQLVARLWPKSVIRCKGICYFSNEKNMCYVFEQAGKQVSLSQAGQWYATMPKDEFETFKKENPDVLKEWDETYGDRMQKLVFIGQGMDREAIETLLDACIEK